MTTTRSRRPRRTQLAVTAAIVVSAAVLTSCATTIEDTGAPASSAPEGSLVGDQPVDTLPATDDELLAELADEMSQLSAQISDDQGSDQERATLARIEAIWLAARPGIESTNPELLNGIETAIDMTRTSVERRRPADADKATQLLSDLLQRRS